MEFVIISLIVVLVVGASALYLVRRNSTGQTDEFIGQTILAWRNKELRNDDFEVQVSHGSVADLFDTFEKDEISTDIAVEKISVAVQGVAAYAPKLGGKKDLAEKIPEIGTDHAETVTAEVSEDPRNSRDESVETDDELPETEEKLPN
ncbi:hypothetical protein [Arcanobacterium hippocoleae]|uniref:Uncharacterized protein n=1 Tax=Arcanobacterium hippocoleae TaxID=149017 RepID=A0ABU1T168_9ACTO|nr:hypothetical protein [Arcanobacterium hippocoleae]MDR6939112.1 hypothetical protein [Arcanobacterium hippocoleae]